VKVKVIASYYIAQATLFLNESKLEGTRCSCSV